MKIKEIMKNIIKYPLLIGLATAGFALVEYAIQDDLYNRSFDLITQKVVKKFDENSNSTLDPQEWRKLAKAVGYPQPIPDCMNLKIYPEYSFGKELVKLRIVSNCGYETGLHFHRRVVPLHEENFYFSISKLEDLSGENFDETKRKVFEEECERFYNTKHQLNHPWAAFAK